MEMLAKVKNEYCLVFCQFKDEIELIGKELRSKNIGYNIYDGSTKIADREKIVNMYPRDKDMELIFKINKFHLILHKKSNLIFLK